MPKYTTTNLPDNAIGLRLVQWADNIEKRWQTIHKEQQELLQRLAETIR